MQHNDITFCVCRWAIKVNEEFILTGGYVGMQEIDRIIFEMKTRLEKEREKYFDPNRPTNTLAEVSQEDLNNVSTLWKLPTDYLYFLEKYSPIFVEWENDNYFALDICGAKDLIIAQNGFSYNPLSKEAIADWPKSYLVIATSNGDPFCIDLECENSPVFYATHGEGEWSFVEDSSSFIDFLNRVVV